MDPGRLGRLAVARVGPGRERRLGLELRRRDGTGGGGRHRRRDGRLVFHHLHGLNDFRLLGEDRGRVVEVEGVAAALDLERDGDHEALVAVGLHGDAGDEALARLVRHGRHRQRDRDGAAVDLGPADLQPRLVAGPVGVNRPFLLRLDFDGVAERGAGTAAQRDRLDADVDLGGRRQAERLEELLHGCEAGGRTVPALDRSSRCSCTRRAPHRSRTGGRPLWGWPWPSRRPCAGSRPRPGRRWETA